MSNKNPDSHLNKDITNTEQQLFEHIKEDPSLKNIPGDKIKLILHKTAEVIEHRFYSGPIPPPDILKEYEKIEKGFANRILEMAENQSLHRKKMENKIVESEINLSKKGQYFGLIVSFLFISAATACAILNQPLPASVIGLGGLTNLVSVFVQGRKESKKK